MLSGRDREDADRALVLLEQAYRALSATYRLFGLDENYPTEATATYEAIGEFMWPDDGPTPRERLEAIDADGTEP